MLDGWFAILYDRGMKITPSTPRAFEFASASGAPSAVVAGAVSRSYGSYGQATAPAAAPTAGQRYAQMKAREEAEKRNAMRKRVGLPPL